MSTSDTATGTLAAVRTDTGRAAARVRHVDELGEDALDRFLDLVESGASSARHEDARFVDGEVIVFTDYYRIDFS